MKRIKLFANCNPLNPNSFICVSDSDSHACSVKSYEDKFLPDYISKLKDLGYRCYKVVSDDSRFDC